MKHPRKAQAGKSKFGSRCNFASIANFATIGRFFLALYDRFF